jgi:hypothetical protein
MVEMERASRKLTWDNLTLLFTQAAHLRSYGEADVSSDEVQVVRGAVYDSRFLQEVSSNPLQYELARYNGSLVDQGPPLPRERS